MLIGLALLTVGAALLGYVVTTRQPAPPPTRPKSLAPRPRSAPPAAALAAAEDTSDQDETLVMRVQSTLSDAVLAPISERNLLPAAPNQFPVPRSAPRVIVAYE